MRRAFILAAGLGVGAFAVLTAASCQGMPTGPSLSDVAIRNISLKSTTDNSGICCCRVVATAENRNAVPVHVTVKFSALDGQKPDPLATIVHFIPDLESGGSRDIDAAGFIFPCTQIRDLRTEVEVKGLTSPPK
jgi:hypothetical protein